MITDGNTIISEFYITRYVLDRIHVPVPIQSETYNRRTGYVHNKLSLNLYRGSSCHSRHHTTLSSP